jgi:hypothetical protein
VPTFEIGGVDVGFLVGVVFLLARLAEFVRRDPATAAKWLRLGFGIVGVLALARTAFLAVVPSIEAPDVRLLVGVAFLMACGAAIGGLRIAHTS